MANESFNNISKIEEALGKYNLNIDDAQVKDAVKRIIAEKVPENDPMNLRPAVLPRLRLSAREPCAGPKPRRGAGGLEAGIRPFDGELGLPRVHFAHLPRALRGELRPRP